MSGIITGAAIVLVLFILLVIILKSSRGGSRGSSWGSSWGSSDEERLAELNAELRFLEATNFLGQNNVLIAAIRAEIFAIESMM
ncbi:hypothetical protein VQL36_05635 [Chengkuizengella sp. SCS-71B]|uniref:hypothetical protein n=1 Tax=Chengkuizengella sp. SCS-71B TaxID=3115290 RepID=UPI0032C21B7D